MQKNDRIWADRCIEYAGQVQALLGREPLTEETLAEIYRTANTIAQGAYYRLRRNQDPQAWRDRQRSQAARQKERNDAVIEAARRIVEENALAKVRE